MEDKEAIALEEVNKIKPKEKWVYCRDVVKGEYLVFEDIIYLGNKKIKFDEPILSVSADVYVALRTINKVIILDKNGEIVWSKRIKKLSAIGHKSEYVAIGKKKKVFLYNTSGRKIFSKKIKGKVLSLDLDEKIFVGSEKGVHAISYTGELLWELYIGSITVIRAGVVVAAAKEDELIVLSPDGEMLWKQKFDSIIYDIYIIQNKVKVYLFSGSIVTLSIDGKIIEISKEEFEYKLLPIPWIIVEKELKKLNLMLKEAKKIKPKKAKKLAKKAKKLYKKRMYGLAYEMIIQAYEELKDAQFQIILPKIIAAERSAILLCRFHNFFDEMLEDIEVDITDLEKYFEISEGIFVLPPLRKGTFIEKRIKIRPKYEGLFMVEINIKSSFGDVQKKFKIRVRGLGFFTRLFVREKERSLVDLIR